PAVHHGGWCSPTGWNYVTPDQPAAGPSCTSSSAPPGIALTSICLAEERNEPARRSRSDALISARPRIPASGATTQRKERKGGRSECFRRWPARCCWSQRGGAEHPWSGLGDEIGREAEAEAGCRFQTHRQLWWQYDRGAAQVVLQLVDGARTD